MFLDLAEEHQFFAIVARDLQDLDKFTQNMTTRSHPQLPWTLEWAALGPLGNAILAEELPAIITFHWIDRNFQTNTTNQRIFQLLMHLSIHYSLNIITTIHLMMMMWMLMLCQICQSDIFVILNVSSSACDCSTGSARCCSSVGSCISVPILGTSGVIDVDGDGSLIWKIKLRLTWESALKWVMMMMITIRMMNMSSVVGTWASVV